MPKLFDSHEQFQEWFSKDIEAHSQDQKALNQMQLNRLHSILKPFMLRRVKKDVEKELGKKKEYQVLCEMTKRQRDLYYQIKGRLSVTDFFQMLESKTRVKNLMNLVMQFRKVCNHPELFERSQNKSSFIFNDNDTLTRNAAPHYGCLKTFWCNWKNPIGYKLPQIIFHEIMDSETKADIIKANPKFYFHNESFVIQSLLKDHDSVFDFMG